ncbi:MAG: alpha/beta fold hydrolase [Alphaproteobacteria bacterium]|nr:alpha/beta fold hydrolase [Alphaproteobacteria bacterium]
MTAYATLSSELVTQAIDQGEHGLFRKELLRIPAEGERPALAVVRKTLPEGPTRPPVVLVHGFAQNRYTWHLSERSMVNWLAARGWDVWNLELRGHGRSRVPEGGRPPAERFDDYVDDVARVAEILEGRAFFVGHSLGGAAIYGAAARAPMAGVVGLGALFRFASENWLLRALSRLTVANRLLLEGPLCVRTKGAGAVIARLYGVSDIAGYAFPVSGWWPGSIEPHLLEERLVRGFDWTSARVWLDMCRWSMEGRFDHEEAWAQVKRPVLVIAGDEDHLMPPVDAKVAYELSTSPDKTWVLLDNYDHEVHWGHLDLVVGKKARAHVWPRIEGWMAARS